jgi:two-component system, OmpR family, KDP operon response regulator KdpE
MGESVMSAAPFNQQRILVVDDELPITRVLRLILTDHGYHVECAHEGESALDLVTTWSPALVITDLYMPHMNGLELCRRIRARSTVPIIVLSVKDQEKTIVEALKAGADDYITKPFAVEELFARMRARLRRSDDSDVAPFVLGDFRVDIQTRRVHVRGIEVRLTPKEFDLFVYFAQRPNTLLPHRALLGGVWGDAGFEQSDYLRVFIRHLRKKLEPDPSNPRYFVTELSEGYRFNPHGETAT